MFATHAVPVSTAAVLLATGSEADYRAGSYVVVQNRGTVAIEVGGADVTIGQGLVIDSKTALSVDVATGSKLYGIASTGTQDVRVGQEG